MKPYIRTLSTDSGQFNVTLDIDGENTQEPCTVCNGERPAEMTMIYKMKLLSVVDESGHEFSWEVFLKEHAAIANDIRTQLEQRGFGKPVCIECQKDLFLPGRNSFSNDA